MRSRPPARGGRLRAGRRRSAGPAPGGPCGDGADVRFGAGLTLRAVVLTSLRRLRRRRKWGVSNRPTGPAPPLSEEYGGQACNPAQARKSGYIPPPLAVVLSARRAKGGRAYDSCTVPFDRTPPRQALCRSRGHDRDLGHNRGLVHHRTPWAGSKALPVRRDRQAVWGCFSGGGEMGGKIVIYPLFQTRPGVGGSVRKAGGGSAQAVLA